MRSSNYIVVLLLVLFCSGVIADSKVCFKQEIPLYCEDELEGLMSLNGNFYFKDQYYEFSARRAFSKNWCESTLLKIQKIMSKGRFCMVFEEQLSESGLTINSVEGPKISWSYFN